MRKRKGFTNGGHRPNSGRKPKLKYDARQLFYACIDKKWDRIMEKLNEYIEEGDKDILKMIIEQRIGKAPQSLELTGNEEKPISVIITDAIGKIYGNSN